MHDCPNVPVLLVGLKKDLCADDPMAIQWVHEKRPMFVTRQQGKTVAQEVGAKAYLECSSLSGDGVNEVFETVTRAALSRRKQSHKSLCCIVM